MPTLLLNDAEPLHWAVAGASIAGIVLLLLGLTGKRFGISAGFDSLCSLVVRAPYFLRPSLVSSNRWRLAMLVGLVGGGGVSALVTGGWAPTWELGLFDARIGWGPAGKLVWMFVGGLFIGFGTRMAGGCTSGHGIFGLANFEASGLVATLSFMGVGFLTTNLIYRVLWT